MTQALIIDDNLINIELLKAYLNLYQIESIGVETGQEGFEMAHSLLPDVIFMDLLMPNHSWNGYRASIELKQSDTTQHIPIVAVSSAGDMTIAEESGCDFFLKRPFDSAKLANILQQIDLISV